LLFNSGRVVMYDIFRRPFLYVNAGNEEIKVHWSLACSFIAGCIAQALANPFDIVKVRMQTEGRRRQLGYEARVSSMGQSFADIYRHGGLPSMWKGVGPSCIRACLMTAGDVGSYDISKRTFKRLLSLEDGLGLRFLSSMCAGFILGFMTCNVLRAPNCRCKKLLSNISYFSFYFFPAKWAINKQPGLKTIQTTLTKC